MASAALNGAEMRGLRYLKSRGQGPIAVAHSQETLWAAASGALTGELIKVRIQNSSINRAIYSN